MVGGVLVLRGGSGYHSDCHCVGITVVVSVFLLNVFSTF